MRMTVRMRAWKIQMLEDEVARFPDEKEEWEEDEGPSWPEGQIMSGRQEREIQERKYFQVRFNP